MDFAQREVEVTRSPRCSRWRDVELLAFQQQGRAFPFSGAHTWIHLSALYGATAPPQERAPVTRKSASLLMKAAFREPEELEGGGSRGNALLAPF